MSNENLNVHENCPYSIQNSSSNRRWYNFLLKTGIYFVKEIILAMNQTPEGEATSAFIVQKLGKKDVRITCLAKGVPVGSSLEFIDRLTMFKAMTERRPF